MKGIYLNEDQIHKYFKLFCKSKGIKITKNELCSLSDEVHDLYYGYDIPKYNFDSTIFVVTYNKNNKLVVKEGMIISIFKHDIVSWNEKYQSYHTEMPYEYLIGFKDDNYVVELDWHGYKEDDIFGTKKEAQKALKKRIIT